MNREASAVGKFALPHLLGALALGAALGGVGSYFILGKPIAATDASACTASAASPNDINFSGIARGTFVDLVPDETGGNNSFLAHFVLEDGRCYQAISNQGTEFVVDGESLWNDETNATSPDMATSRERLFAAVEKAKGRRVFLRLVAPDGLDYHQAWLDLVVTDLPPGTEPWMPAAAPAKK